MPATSASGGASPSPPAAHAAVSRARARRHGSMPGHGRVAPRWAVGRGTAVCRPASRRIVGSCIAPPCMASPPVARPCIALPRTVLPRIVTSRLLGGDVGRRELRRPQGNNLRSAFIPSLPGGGGARKGKATADGRSWRQSFTATSGRRAPGDSPPGAAAPARCKPPAGCARRIRGL